jgi:competence protein ComEC
VRLPRPPGLDLRLSVPVVVAWAVSWFAPLTTGPVCLYGGAAALVGAAIIWLRWRCLVAVLVLVAAATAAIGVGLRLAPLSATPWAAVGPDANVQLDAVVTDDPHTKSVPGFGGTQLQATVVVRAERVVVDAETYRTRVPVLVVGYGAPWSDLTWGDVVHVTGRLLPRAAGDPFAGVLIARGPPQVTRAPPRLLTWTAHLRERLARAADGLPPDARGLLPALVVGDTSAVSPDLTAAMRVSGLAHVTAVSGANVVLLLTAVLTLARWLGVRRWRLPAVGLMTVTGFVLIARPDPSVLRAAVMGLVGIAAVSASGRRSGPSALLAATLVLLLVDPWLSRTWGFALSVAATAGLLLLSPVLRQRLPSSWPDYLRDAVAVALAAQIATAPLVAALSGRVTLFGVVANVLAAPAVGPATILGVVTAAVAMIAPPVAHLVAWVTAAPVLWIAGLARFVAALPEATLRSPHGIGGAGSLLGVSLLATAAVVTRRPRSRGARTLVASALAVSATVFVLGPGRWPPPGWLFVACDVGQGDALVLSVARGTAVVVDAGPDPQLVDQCLHRLGVTSVPVVVLTHFHADHVEGLPGVLHGRRVGTLLVGPLDDPPEEVDRVQRWAAGAHVPIRTAVSGETDHVGGVAWQVLWPSRLLLGEGSDPNNNSLVLRVVTQGHVLLLTGDLETAAQTELLASGVDLRAEVLKVPHHGSAAQDPDFLAATGAGLAVISVGIDNTYGHPAPITLSLLAADGMQVRRTDEDGDVAVVATSSGLRVVTHQP